jgi:PKD repeat protein
VAYLWDFGETESTESGGPVKPYNYGSSGVYTVTLQVQDNAGSISVHSAEVTVTVTAPPQNEEPVADFNFSCTELDCEFNASASYDPDGGIVAYRWRFGESNAVESGGPEKNHSYASPGEYTVILEVEDDAGEQSTRSKTVTVTVTVPPTENPDISLSANPEKFKGNKSVRLTWSDAEESSVEIYKDGTLMAIVANSGAYLDEDLHKKTKSVTYRVCEPVSNRCSAKVDARF